MRQWLAPCVGGLSSCQAELVDALLARFVLEHKAWPERKRLWTDDLAPAGWSELTTSGPAVWTSEQGK